MTRAGLGSVVMSIYRARGFEYNFIEVLYISNESVPWKVTGKNQQLGKRRDPPVTRQPEMDNPPTLRTSDRGDSCYDKFQRNYV